LQKFVQGLSVLSRGTLEEKLSWTFQLYDINSDGRITKEEMSDIVTAVYNLMGHPIEEKVDEDRIKEKVESIFNVSVAYDKATFYGRRSEV
jgi:Ca2+-binding EF-hand superfamily protein